MSTRTSVRFGTTLANLIRDRMSYFEEAFTEVTSQYLLYGYRKKISTAYNGFILVQASRNQGLFCLEVGLTRGETYPYHRFFDYPDIAVSGYREAVQSLVKGYNHSEEYQNPDSLFRALFSVLKDAEMAISRLMEKGLPKIQSTYEHWHKLYEEWLEVERNASGAPGYRYPALSAEALAFEIIENTLARGTFDRYLGPMKFKYRNPTFMNCHVYLLARGLEFLEPPEPPVNPFDPTPPANRKVPAALDDPISGLTGRLPQSYCVELSPSTSAKTTQFAFLKSLSAVEALLKLDAQGKPVRSDGFEIFTETGQALVDAPDYGDYSDGCFAKPVGGPAPTASVAPAAPPSPAQPERKEMSLPKNPIMNPDDDDPIAMLESRFGLR